MKNFSSLKKMFAQLVVASVFVSPLMKQCDAQSCTDNFEPNDSRRESAGIQTNTNYHALIGTTLDVDWFRFVITADEPNVLITLSELSENYNLYLFDDTTKAKIGSSKHKKLEPDTIIMNGLAPGKYDVK